jgi:hypothetical protein
MFIDVTSPGIFPVAPQATSGGEAHERGRKGAASPSTTMMVDDKVRSHRKSEMMRLYGSLAGADNEAVVTSMID